MTHEAEKCSPQQIFCLQIQYCSIRSRWYSAPWTTAPWTRGQSGKSPPTRRFSLTWACTVRKMRLVLWSVCLHSCYLSRGLLYINRCMRHDKRVSMCALCWNAKHLSGQHVAGAIETADIGVLGGCNRIRKMSITAHSYQKQAVVV